MKYILKKNTSNKLTKLLLTCSFCFINTYSMTPEIDSFSPQKSALSASHFNNFKETLSVQMLLLKAYLEALGYLDSSKWDSASTARIAIYKAFLNLELRHEDICSIVPNFFFTKKETLKNTPNLYYDFDFANKNTTLTQIPNKYRQYTIGSDLSVQDTLEALFQILQTSSNLEIKQLCKKIKSCMKKSEKEQEELINQHSKELSKYMKDFSDIGGIILWNRYLAYNLVEDTKKQEPETVKDERISAVLEISSQIFEAVEKFYIKELDNNRSVTKELDNNNSAIKNLWELYFSNMASDMRNITQQQVPKDKKNKKMEKLGFENPLCEYESSCEDDKSESENEDGELASQKKKIKQLELELENQKNQIEQLKLEKAIRESSRATLTPGNENEEFDREKKEIYEAEEVIQDLKSESQKNETEQLRLEKEKKWNTKFEKMELKMRKTALKMEKMETEKEKMALKMEKIKSDMQKMKTEREKWKTQE